MSIKVLFWVMVLSAAAVIGVAVAAFFRVWWNLKSRRAKPQSAAEPAGGKPAQNLPERHRQ